MPARIFRALTLVLALSLLASCSNSQAAPPVAARGLQVVELFQSQGCSSCPPANRNVMDLSTRPDILALSWQVTYWDYLGWKDVFAKPAFTERQHAYAAALGHDRVWTPQVVINGRGDVIGGSRGQLDDALRRFARADNGVTVQLAANRVALSGPAKVNASVYAVRYDPRTIEVPIKAGENGGKTLPHRNIVRQLLPLGSYAGGAMAWPLPPAPDKAWRTAILVQAGPAGAIIAAAHD